MSPLQRLQGLSGSWRRKTKRPRLAKDGRDHRAGEQNGAGQQGGDEPDLPEAPAMQVYVHGIDEAVLQSGLASSSLWPKIQLNRNLEVGDTNLPSIIILKHWAERCIQCIASCSIVQGMHAAG